MNYPIILARNLTKNPQKRHFCALFAFGTPVFGRFEHKIEVFVSEWAIFPGFWAFRAQNRAFCARRGCNASCICRFVFELRCLKRCVSGCCIWWEAKWGGNTIRGQPFGLTSCLVAEGGLGPPTSGLWARRATNCSTPRCCECKGMYFFSYYQIFCGKRNGSLF